MKTRTKIYQIGKKTNIEITYSDDSRSILIRSNNHEILNSFYERQEKFSPMSVLRMNDGTVGISFISDISLIEFLNWMEYGEWRKNVMNMIALKYQGKFNEYLELIDNL